MFDSIQMYLSQKAAPKVDFLGEVPCHLTNITFHDSVDHKYYDGWMKNLKILVTDTRVKISGSMAKFYTGQNLKNLGRTELALALDKMEEVLNLPIGESTITSLDIGNSLIVNSPPNQYLKYLGDCSGLDRLEQPSGINYRNKYWEICFYDKIKECLDKGTPIHSEWNGKNVLRYELRLKKRVAKFLAWK
jgi:hypothetical protein